MLNNMQRIENVDNEFEILSETEILSMQKKNPQIPLEYLNFLRIFGCGYFESNSFTIYRNLIRTDEFNKIFKSKEKQLKNILLFGNDVDGNAYGFDTENNWNIVKIDVGLADIEIVDISFGYFLIRQGII